jgi:SAM-dependent methyltransferase
VTTVGEVPETATVVDLAAGTGKLTRLLVRRYARVIAIEPLDGMRAVLERVVPEAEALPGTAERIPLPDACAGAVYVAEAFHWFGGSAAVAEVARVLEPGGVLVLAWNNRAGPHEPPLPDAYRARMRESFKRADWPYGGDRWRAAVEAGPFGPIHHESFPYEHVHTRDTMLAYVASVSWIASLPVEERERELAEFAALLPEGTWRVPLRTDVYWTRRQTRHE